MKRNFQIASILLLYPIIISMDLYSKSLTSKIFHAKYFLSDFIGIKFVANYGFANGSLSQHSTDAIQVITLFFITVLISINVSILLFNKAKHFPIKFYLSLIIAGMSSNAIDRFINGYVADFIFIKTEIYRSPVFNLADLFQIIGVIGFLFYSIKYLDQILPKDDKRSFLRQLKKLEFKLAFLIFFIHLIGFTFLTTLFLLLISSYDIEVAKIPNLKILLSLSLLLFFCVSIVFSHKILFRLIGPIYALKRYINDLKEGKDYDLNLREGDQLPEVIMISKEFKKLYLKK